jgi:diphthamide synthase (EF-2-diphthine--ammonia ligase)
VLGREGQHEVVGLVTTINSTTGGVAMHAVPEDLLNAQASALGLPVWPVSIPWPCPNAQYEAAMAEVIASAAAQGVTRMAFGDLFLEDIRGYRQQQLAGTGIEPVFPVWGLATPALAREMIGGGLRALLVCVDPTRLDPSFAGREFDERLLSELPSTVDPCGENGEFHTFVYDGPGFRQPLNVAVAGIEARDGLVFASLQAGA